MSNPSQTEGVMPKKIFQVLRRETFRQTPAWIFFALAGLLINLIAFATALYSMQVYDRVLPRQGTETLIVLTVGVAIASGLQLFLQKLRSTISHYIVQRIDRNLSVTVYDALIRTRMDQVPLQAASFASQLQSYESIRGFLVALMSFGVVDAPYAILFLIGLFALGGIEVTLVPLILLGILLPFGIIQHLRVRKHASKQFVSGNRKYGFLVESIKSMEWIKANDLIGVCRRRWRELSESVLHSDLKSREISESTAYFVQFAQQMAYVGVVAVGAYLAVTQREITSGTIIAASILAGRILAPIASVPMLMVQSAQVKIAAKALDGVLALQKDNDGNNQPLRVQSLRGEWELRDMQYTFKDRKQPLLIERMHIKPGERIGIIGPIGVGKSALLKILTGLYPIESGHAEIDGISLQLLSRDCLAANIGYFPQSPTLMSGTLRENLTGGRAVPDATLLDISRQTGLLSLISSHPRGLDMPIMENGEGLSSGQRQLVGMTSLLVQQKKILVLDEPTSSLDGDTEQQCLNAVQQSLGSDGTLILVTHKLGSLALVNRLIVLLPSGKVLDGPRNDVLAYLQNNNSNLTPVPETATTHDSSSATSQESNPESSTGDLHRAA